MNQNEINALLNQLMSPDDVLRQIARLALLQQDEAIVGLLVDAFYAGVSLALGVELLNVIGQIGGYEAVALFRDLSSDPGTRAEWTAIAVKWLRHDGFFDEQP
jgi:hypothetical protein